MNLRDIPEQELHQEIRRREIARMAGCCDYCEKPPSEPVCAHPERHVKPNRPKAKAGFTRLVTWLRDHPDVLSELVDELRLLVPRCEGFQGSCGYPVVGPPTPSQTMYEWDGEGEDPNQDLMLCPVCSAAYTEQMNALWDEYNSGRM